MSAMLDSRMLALSGTPAAVSEGITGMGWGPYGFVFAYLAIVLALGCIIDSVSIMLIMQPIARSFGMDIVWFGVITVVAVEIGPLTPPFGVSVYTAKSALNVPRIPIWDIFSGAFPFVRAMTVILALRIARLKRSFESLRGLILGLLHRKIGVESSRIDHACDAVLYKVFES
ncbi:MAG: TRAP transporter large permease subunit [bacterium]